MENKTNLIKYIAVAAIAAGATYFATKGDKPDLGPYPPNDVPHTEFTFDDIIHFSRSYNKRAEFIKEEVRRRTSDSSFTPARAITFDYQEFKNYLDFIEKNAEEANIRISGLRFYFGKYDEKQEKRNASRQMLFYNPTLAIKGKNIAYALQKKTGKTAVIPLSKVIDSILDHKGKKPNIKQESSVNEASVLSFLANTATFGGPQSQAGNHGQINPPPPNAILVPAAQ